MVYSVSSQLTGSIPSAPVPTKGCPSQHAQTEQVEGPPKKFSPLFLQGLTPWVSGPDMGRVARVDQTTAAFWRRSEKVMGDLIVPNLVEKPYLFYGAFKKADILNYYNTPPGLLSPDETLVATEKLNSNAAQFPIDPNTLPQCLRALGVCPCPQVTGMGRRFLEYEMLEFLKQSEHPKEALLTLVSVGAGDCYQELVFIAKLVAAEYKKIQAVLIENKKSSESSLREFCQRYFKQCKIDVFKYRSVEEYVGACQVEKTLKPNMLLFIDISDLSYYINDVPFHYYAFQLLKKHKIVNQNTIIAFTPTDFIKKITTYICGQAKNIMHLSELEGEKVGVVIHPNTPAVLE